MPQVSTAALARDARRRGRGLGAFNVVHLEQARAYESAAREAGVGVVLQLSENAVAHHGGLTAYAAGVLALARGSDVPVAVHLDHAEDVDLVSAAVDLGFSSVMYDGSRLPYEQNLAATAGVVRACRSAGVDVEAELGEVGGKDGAHHPTARTDPAEAAAFVAATGVDLLAVAVGSSHAMTDRDARLDVELVARLAAAVPVPLVLHGSSGVSDAGLVAAVAAGIVKVNVATHLNRVFTAEVRRVLAAEPTLVDTRRWTTAGARAAGAEAQRLLELYRTA
ncbi:fructose-bisphosphate aldolase [Geodermatophilus sp. Leaf369]|uniref:class II fructose-bisphosphate aldolase n=1 Tax=Geodermatophilus sp. Leaf369 TaxID=1736354 RepID=UPI0006F29D6C|nr:class II fructose-bisphosphate aldolase [Geodermatophilus sp. Leaf369]KQS56975.1 fructose-bisphosphate aldolase [Geodermatophilus sp. Leaf369]